MKLKLIIAAFLSLVSIHAITQEMPEALTADELAILQTVYIQQVVISAKNPVKVKLGAMALMPGVPTCAMPNKDKFLKKENNPYFGEQFTAILTSQKLRQPINISVREESGTCFIEEITLTNITPSRQ